MATREILTLQFGHYSNYIGTHFWNIQELSFDYTGLKKSDVNHDVLYREGENARGEVTYTPRLLLADLKGSLKTLQASGGLVDDETEQENCEWDTIEKIEDPAPERNQYLIDIDTGGTSVEENTYNLEEDVKTWTDYMYPRLHSRSVNLVNEYCHDNENVSMVFHSILSIAECDDN